MLQKNDENPLPKATITLVIPELYLKAMDKLIEMSLFKSRSAFIRASIEQALKQEEKDLNCILKILKGELKYENHNCKYRED